MENLIFIYRRSVKEEIRSSRMRIVICDDEDIYIRQITNYIIEYFKKHNLKQPEIIGFTSGEALLKDTGDKDIAFLDVEMQGISGIHTGREIKNQNKNALIFIITSYPEYLDEAMKFRVFRYLTKPIDKDRLFRNLKDAVYVYNTSTVKVMVETKDKIETIYERDIIFVEAKGKLTVIQTIRGQLMSIEQIQHWEATLNKRCFFRTHRSYIVNMKYINSFDTGSVSLYQNKFQTYLSRRRYKEFKDAYLLYLESIR